VLDIVGKVILGWGSGRVKIVKVVKARWDGEMGAKALILLGL